ncbi:MAG TPA: phosphatase PAP2 family protein [Puia sp.]|nr:phosphatase PAP2 family protein [Puia sp.]
MIYRYCLLFFLLGTTFVSSGQQDSLATVRKKENKITAGALLLPAALITYGVVALNNPSLQTFDRNIRKKVWIDNPHSRLPLDDYLQYSPGAAVYLLNAAGIKGKNNFRDRTIIYLLANALMGVTIETLKHTTPAERPDGSGNDGFPSGHTGTAFVAAEFLRQEYKDVSAWYGVGGYAAAIATGFLRVYNDKHWFSELLPGAGIGILSTKIAYWSYPYIQRHLFKKKPSNMVLVPFYQSGTAGISFNYFFAGK